MGFWEFMGYWFVLSLIPYGMYIAAYLLGGQKPGYGLNKVPVWKGQSKAFLPGDLGLTLFLTVGFKLFLQSRDESTIGIQWLILAAVILSLVTSFVGKRVLYSKSSYSESSWNSLTKRYHDGVMFATFPFLVVLWGVPGYYFGISTGKWRIIAVGFFGLAFWVAGLIWDALSKEVPNEFQHQAGGKPIWHRQ